MVGDADIVRRLTSVLRKADLSTATTAAIRKQLEKDLGVDLSDRKAFIREQVDLYLKEQQADEEAERSQENGEVAEEADEQEEEEEEEEQQEEGQEGQEEQEEDEEESKPTKKARQIDHEPDSKRFRAKIDRAIKASLPKEKKKRVGGVGGLNKVCGLSPELQAVIGETELPRTQVKILADISRSVVGFCKIKIVGRCPNRRWPVWEKTQLMFEPKCPNDKAEKMDISDNTDNSWRKQNQVVKLLWVYIRENELQDPDNKRKILCNDELRGLFGVDSTDIFKMNKLLSKHIWPLDRPADAEPKAKKPKTEKTVNEKPRAEKKESERPKTEKETDRQKPEKKDSGRGRGSGLVPLSDALAEFLGTNETEMAQHDVVKSVWDYITENKLQNPSDKKIIICDSKLQGLFGCDTFVGFNITKLLARHLKG